MPQMTHFKPTETLSPSYQRLQRKHWTRKFPRAATCAIFVLRFRDCVQIWNETGNEARVSDHVCLTDHVYSTYWVPRQVKSYLLLFFKMRYVAAYLLARLGGNDNPDASDLKKILESVGAEVDEDKLRLVVSELRNKDIDEVGIAIHCNPCCA